MKNKIIGRPRKFYNGKKRILQLPQDLWDKLDAIAADQNKVAQDIIYEKLEGIIYEPEGNFDNLMNDIIEVLKKHKI